MSYTDNLQKQLEANKEYSANKGGDYFDFKEGDNTFRILSEPLLFFQKYDNASKRYMVCYTDCGYKGNSRFMAWVLDKGDNKIKLANKIPFSKGQEIIGLENDQDYGFTGFPMPYDVTIKAKNAGTKEVEYSAVLPRPVKELSPEIIDELREKKPLTEILEVMKAKQKEKHMQDGTWQKNQEARAKLHQELKEARVVGGGKPIDPAIEYPTEEIDPKDIPF